MIWRTTAAIPEQESLIRHEIYVLFYFFYFSIETQPWIVLAFTYVFSIVFAEYVFSIVFAEYVFSIEMWIFIL